MLWSSLHVPGQPAAWEAKHLRLRRHSNGVPVRLGTGLRVLAVDLYPHAFNHFRLFAIRLFVVVNEIAALGDPGA